uniref:Ig-like domain-containing protein n=1 Tax=Cyprinus carpio carpio TaxID=630221 RepID=A0A9J8C143_CYPCA
MLLVSSRCERLSGFDWTLCDESLLIVWRVFVCRRDCRCFCFSEELIVKRLIAADERTLASVTQTLSRVSDKPLESRRFRSTMILRHQCDLTSCVHSFQLMYGCELDTDGTKRGYMQYGYDGQDFISLDKNTLTFTAANPQAMITKNKWEANRAEAEQWKGYLENMCIEWLQKYVGYGKDTLERKVSPQVSLLQKDPSSPVMCHTTSFYPSGVTITWQKNGQDHDEDVDLGELIINEDGTFQRASTLNVKPEEWKNNKFSCVVEHQGKTIREILTEDKIKTNYAPFPIGIIIGVVAAVLLLIVIGVAGYKVYQKKKGFKPVNGKFFIISV